MCRKSIGAPTADRSVHASLAAPALRVRVTGLLVRHPGSPGAGRGLPAQMLPVSDSWPVSLADRFLSRKCSEIRWPVGPDTECGGCYSKEASPGVVCRRIRVLT